MNNNLSDLDEDLPLFEHKDKIKKLITQAKKEALEELKSEIAQYSKINDLQTKELIKIIQDLINKL